MDQDVPASLSQKMYAQKLGIKVPPGISKGDLSELITKAAKPDVDLLVIADALGLKYGTNTSQAVIQRAIDSEVKRRERMKDESLAIRVGADVRYEDQDYKISSFARFTGADWYVWLAPNRGGVKRKVLLLSLARALGY